MTVEVPPIIKVIGTENLKLYNSRKLNSIFTVKKYILVELILIQTRSNKCITADKINPIDAKFTPIKKFCIF